MKQHKNQVITNHHYYSKNTKAKSTKKESSLPAKKKQLGQHFLTKQSVVDHMIEKVNLTTPATILEIGCGEGFLTQAILGCPQVKKLFCIELDQEWFSFVQKKLGCERLSLIHANVLEYDFTLFNEQKPLILLANLPYQITFPILFKLVKHRALFQEGVIMVQEEVAQKLAARSGKGLSGTTLFLQHYFSWELLEKIEPGAFNPPPKVYSRLVYFKTKPEPLPIINEEEFWRFVKAGFISPRQTLKNNYRTTHYPLHKISDDILALRAQQLSFAQFLALWHQIQ